RRTPATTRGPSPPGWRRSRSTPTRRRCRRPSTGSASASPAPPPRTSATWAKPSTTSRDGGPPHRRPPSRRWAGPPRKPRGTTNRRRRRAMPMVRTQSQRLFARARELLPGGVNSPVRAFRGVGGEPVFFQKGEGAWLTDVDGNRYVDFVGSWGPLILGHCHGAVVEAVTAAARSGASYGAPHPGEVELAELVRAAMPSVEKVRMVSSGTEATAAAVRLARGATGRDCILKFEGCYHGAADSFLVKAGSGVETLGLPDSPGVPAALAGLTLTAPFNDLAAAEAVFQRRGKEIAAVIIEPVVGNMGVLVPRPGYLQGLKELASRHGALLILDEVMTGFRVARGGAQQLYGVTADLTTMGKVIGGGLPVGAYGGRRDLMAKIAPEGPIYQAGTLSGNPLAVAAGIAT